MLVLSPIPSSILVFAELSSSTLYQVIPLTADHVRSGPKIGPLVSPVAPSTGEIRLGARKPPVVTVIVPIEPSFVSKLFEHFANAGWSPALPIGNV